MKNFKFNIDYKTSTIILGAIVVLGILCCAVCCIMRYHYTREGTQKMHYSFNYRDSDGHSIKKGDIFNGMDSRDKDVIGKIDRMGEMMQHMNDGLMNKTGDEFDKAFLFQMIEHHNGAVVMAKKVLEISKRKELLKMAQDIISAQTKEIEMMESWQKSLFTQ